jgi:hypothetical protein
LEIKTLNKGIYIKYKHNDLFIPYNKIRVITNLSTYTNIFVDYREEPYSFYDMDKSYFEKIIISINE